MKKKMNIFLFFLSVSLIFLPQAFAESIVAPDAEEVPIEEPLDIGDDSPIEEPVPVEGQNEPILYHEIITGKVNDDGTVTEISVKRVDFVANKDSDSDTPPGVPDDEDSSDKARIGAENRVDVNAASGIYRAVARLTFNTDDGTGFSCTGWRAGKRVMMTNGHCVYDKGRSKFHTSNRADFGYNNGAFVQRVYPSLLVVSKWYTENKSGVDWGMYIFPANVANSTGWFGTKNYNTNWNGSNYWRVSGYGSNMTGHPFSTQFQTANSPLCKVASTHHDGRQLFHDCDTGQGNSGSPIYGTWSGVAYAVGVNYGGWGPRDANRMNSCSPFAYGSCGNYGTRQSVFVDTLIEKLAAYP